MWKYPELVDDIIPWVALLVAWHFTWEFVLDNKWARRGAVAIGKDVNRLLIWPLVFIVGGGVSVLYWIGINKSLTRLSAIAAQRHAALTNPTSHGEKALDTAPKTAPEDEPGPGPASGSTDSLSTVLTPATPKGGAMVGDFPTSGRGEYEVDILHPAAEELSFTPPGTVLRRDKLPAKILVNGHNLTILRFTDTGFVINDNGWRDLRIQVALIKSVHTAPPIKPEVTRAPPEPLPSESPIQISAAFSDPQSPVIVVSNLSDSVAEGVGWNMVAIRRSDLSYFGFAGQSVGYVKPHTDSARYSLELDRIAKASDPVGGQIHDGDELIGSVSVDCPHCEARTYIVHLVWKRSGWFFEYSKAGGKHVVPKDMSSAGRARYVEWLAGDSFKSNRVEILPKPQ